MLYQQRSAPPPGGEPDEFVMSDDSIDRMGDVLEQNWQFDKLNTIALFNHDRDKIIGSWRDVSVRNGRLVGRLVWTNSNEWPGVKYLRDLVREGLARLLGRLPADRQRAARQGQSIERAILQEIFASGMFAGQRAGNRTPGDRQGTARPGRRDLCKPATEDFGRSPAAHRQVRRSTPRDQKGFVHVNRSYHRQQNSDRSKLERAARERRASPAAPK